jgi:hypothetical protein
VPTARSAIQAAKPIRDDARSRARRSAADSRVLSVYRSTNLVAGYGNRISGRTVDATRTGDRSPPDRGPPRPTPARVKPRAARRGPRRSRPREYPHRGGGRVPSRRSRRSPRLQSVRPARARRRDGPPRLRPSRCSRRADSTRGPDLRIHAESKDSVRNRQLTGPVRDGQHARRAGRASDPRRS